MGKYYKTAYMLPEQDLTAEEHRWLFLNGYRGHLNIITLVNPSEADTIIAGRIQSKMPELKVLIK
jgi:hypothetical protein